MLMITSRGTEEKAKIQRAESQLDSTTMDLSNVSQEYLPTLVRHIHGIQRAISIFD